MRNSGVIRYAGKRGVVWRIKYVDATGKQVQETLGKESDGWTRKKAAAELCERMVRTEKKGWRKPTALTLGAYADTWFERGKTQRAWKVKTARSYEASLNRFKPMLGKLPISTVRPSHIAEYVAEASKTHEPATVNFDVTILHGIFKSAKREELVDFNPAEDVERPKVVQKRWRILEPSEVPAVLNAFEDEQARTVFLTVMLTGLRRHEIQNLRWRDVVLTDPERGEHLRVRESKSESGVRIVPVTPKLSEALWQHRRQSAYQGEDELVFSGPSGKTYNAEGFKRQFHAALKVAGINDYVRPFHDLRHSSITNDAAAGANPTALMAKAGHADMKTTKRYLHLAGVLFRDEADALERRLLGAGTSAQEATEALD
jgi:integrase